MRSERKKKSRPEWVAEVEEVRYALQGGRGGGRGGGGGQPERTWDTHPPRWVVERRRQASARESVAASAALINLVKHQFDWHLLRVYCAAYEDAWCPVQECVCVPLPPPCKRGSSNKPTSIFSSTDRSLNATISPLQMSCLDSISSHFALYDPEDIALVLSMLPPQHCSVLSAMCCRKDLLTDANICAFAQYVDVLFVGGSHVTDRGLESLFSALTRPQQQQQQLQLPSLSAQLPQCWEDLCDSDISVLNSSGCKSLERLVILSPCITVNGLAKALATPFHNLQTVSAHGKCAAAISANCSNVFVEAAVKSKDDLCGAEDDECRRYVIAERDVGAVSDSVSEGEARVDGEVVTCSTSQLKLSLGWS